MESTAVVTLLRRGATPQQYTDMVIITSTHKELLPFPRCLGLFYFIIVIFVYHLGVL